MKYFRNQAMFKHGPRIYELHESGMTYKQIAEKMSMHPARATTLGTRYKLYLINKGYIRGNLPV